MVLLGICVMALLIGALRLATEPPQLPSGSSYSAQPDGALGLYTWVDELGGRAQRLRSSTIDGDAGGVVVLEPASAPDQATIQALDAVADRGGTLVLAGDSLPWLVYARQFGVSVEPSTQFDGAHTPDGIGLPFGTRYRLQADGAEPLLMSNTGEWLGVRVPYRQGTLLVIGSPLPLTNAGLRDEATARFVFRDILGPLRGQTLAFDEIGRSPPSSATSGPSSVNELLFQTPPGQALLYVGLLTFLYLLLSGRRLGPPLVAQSAGESRRTMYEHVQMLAGLYQRAGQLSVVRAAFGRHYARLLARGGVPRQRAGAFAQALDKVHAARTEAELVSAVAGIDAVSEGEQL
jgi:hypothetical protein